MRTARLFAIASLTTLCGCPVAEDPPDARVFIQALLGADCEDSFLARAEPTFFAEQVQARVEVAVAGFTRNLANSDVTFSRAAYEACLKAAQANDCSTLNADDSPCASVFRGTLNDGQACAEPVECARGLSCFQVDNACGVCRQIAVSGQPCDAANCDDGLFCDDNQLCAPLPTPTTAAANDRCTLATGCGGINTGLACKNNVCTPIEIVEENAACELGPQAVLYCKDSSSTHICDAAVCTPRPGLGSACSAAGSCDATVAACVDGQCLDEGQVGDTCVNGFGCQLGAVCRQGICAALDDISVPPVCN